MFNNTFERVFFFLNKGIQWLPHTNQQWLDSVFSFEVIVQDSEALRTLRSFLGIMEGEHWVLLCSTLYSREEWGLEVLSPDSWTSAVCTPSSTAYLMITVILGVSSMILPTGQSHSFSPCLTAWCFPFCTICFHWEGLGNTGVKLGCFRIPSLDSEFNSSTWLIWHFPQWLFL